MNSSLDALVKNLSDNDFKYLLQEFTGTLLELVKKKECMRMTIQTVWKIFLMINCLIDANFIPFYFIDYFYVIDVWIVSKSKTWSGLFKNRCFIISWCFRKVYYYIFRTLWVRSFSLF